MDVLKYAAGVCAAGYQPGTIERGLLERFAAGDMAYQDETRNPLGPHKGAVGKTVGSAYASSNLARRCR